MFGQELIFSHLKEEDIWADILKRVYDGLESHADTLAWKQRKETYKLIDDHKGLLEDVLAEKKGAIDSF